MSLKYKGKKGALENLTKKVISGGGGVWGDVQMAAHPQLTVADASEMINYILSLSDDKPKVKSLPVKGSYTIKTDAKDKGEGVYIFRAAYKDRGALGMSGLASEDEFVLRAPSVSTSKFDIFSDINKMSFNNRSFVMVTKNGAFVGLSKIDLTGISSVDVSAVAPKQQVTASGGVIELRIDSPDGKLIGKSEFIGDVAGAMLSPKPYSIIVESTEGVHDFYLVFKNPDMGKAQVMMIAFNVQFKTGDASAVPAAMATYSTDELNAFTGKYKMTGLPFPYIEVSVKEGRLAMDAGGQAGPIDPTTTKDKFDASGRAMITFIKENSKVTRLKMESMGMAFEGVKE